MVTTEPLRPEEFEQVANWLSRPDVCQWLSSDWRDRDINAGLVAAAVRNRRNRMLAVRADGLPVGIIALSEIDLGDRAAMIWYALGRQDFAGRGITTEAVKQTLALAFLEMGMSSIYAWVIEGNDASLKVLQKSGFREVGRIRRAARLHGAQVDRIYLDAVATDEMS